MKRPRTGRKRTDSVRLQPALDVQSGARARKRARLQVLLRGSNQSRTEARPEPPSFPSGTPHSGTLRSGTPRNDPIPVRAAAVRVYTPARFPTGFPTRSRPSARAARITSTPAANASSNRPATVGSPHGFTSHAPRTRLSDPQNRPSTRSAQYHGSHPARPCGLQSSPPIPLSCPIGQHGSGLSALQASAAQRGERLLQSCSRLSVRVGRRVARLLAL